MNTFKKLIPTLKLFILCSLTTFILSAITSDWYIGIFLGVFILIFHSLYSGMLENKPFWERETITPITKSFFTNKSGGILVFSIFLLFWVTLITNFIFYSLIDYCDGPAFISNEEKCALQKAQNAINDQYPADDTVENF